MAGNDAGATVKGGALLARWQAASKWQRRGVVAGVVYIVYALLGYFVVSPLARDEIVTQLTEHTGREIVLDEFVFNPMALSVTANGFALRDPDGSDFVAFDQFYLNFELSSLLRWSWHFGDIALVKPRIRVAQHADESFNFDDLVARLVTDDDDVAADVAANDVAADSDSAAAIPAISVASLTIDSGNFVFRDEARATPDELSFNDLSFAITDFSTRSNSSADNESLADGASANNSYTFEVSGPRGGRFLWAGKLNFNPLVAEGKLALEGLQLQPLIEFADDRLNFSVPTGEMDISTHYRYEAADELKLTLSGGVVALRDLRIDDQRSGEQAIQIPALTLSDIALNTIEENITVGDITIEKPNLKVVMLADGTDLETLFLPVAPVTDTAANITEISENKSSVEIDPAEAEVVETAEDVADSSAPATESDWNMMIKTIQLIEAAIVYQDSTLREPADLRLAPMSLTLHNVSPATGTRFDFDGKATVADSGEITLSGEGQLSPFSLQSNIGVEAFPLTAIQPWIRDGLAVQLPSGELGGQWSLNATESGADVDVRLSGQATINNLSLKEQSGEPLVAFSELRLGGIDVDSKAMKVSLNTVAFDQLQMSSLIDAAGKQAGDRIVIPVPRAPSPSPSSSTSTSTSTSTAAEESDWRILIAELTLADSAMMFANESVSPHFKMGIHQLAGSMKNLDSTSSTAATLDLTGKVDKYAPFSVKGTLNPLAQRPVVDVEVLLDGYEMTSLTPYTGEYLGYAVSSGQLRVDTFVKLDDTFLHSRNNIQATNFFLGEKVESEDALKVPIKLGLGVLRNRAGVIEVPVVAKGDLSDPSVSARGLIMKALGNVLVKAATSPFSMLAGLAGGADLSSIPFSEGAVDVGDEGRKSLKSLETVMAKRPQLKISLSGSASAEDRLALAAIALGTEVQGEDWISLEEGVNERSVRRRIVKLYEQQGNSADTLLPDLSTMTEEQQDAAKIEQAKAAFIVLQKARAAAVTEDQLQALAAARAQNTKAVLVEEMNMDPARLFIADPVIAAPGESAISGVALGLTGN